MNNLTTQINLILHKKDIEGFVEAGAPSDEYFSEAEAIALAVSQLSAEQRTALNIQAIVLLIWTENFNLSELDLNSRREAIQCVSRDIESLY